MDHDPMADSDAADMSSRAQHMPLDAARITTSRRHHPFNHFPKPDPKIPIIVYGTGQENIVDIFAQVLAMPAIHRQSFHEVSQQDSGFVVGLQASFATDSVASRDQRTVIAIQTTCCNATTTPDSSLSTNYDYEFLYTDSPSLVRDVARFITFILGQSTHHECLLAKPRSYFLSTTFPDMKAALPNIDILTVGCDAVEIRVDLLREPLDDGSLADIPSLGYVGHQVMMLRQRTELPIIFSCRSTDFSNGRFPKENTSLYYNYLTRAIQWGVNYIDVEIWLPEAMRSALYQRRGHSRIMSAFHDFSGSFQWMSQHAEDVFMQSMRNADIVRMVIISNDQNANLELEYFRSKLRRSIPNAAPFSAVNMGVDGQISRTSNKVFTPVTHPLLPLVAAPGQLSVADINARLFTMGQLNRMNFFTYCSTNGASTRLLFYQKCLNELGLPHNLHKIGRVQKDLEGFAAMCRGLQFGGALLEPGIALSELVKASPLVPNILESNEYSITEAARAIGIVDIMTARSGPTSITPPLSATDSTITNSAPQSPGRSSDTTTIIDNTLWRGIVKVLILEQTPSAFSQRTAVVLSESFEHVGAALFALKTLGLSKVYAVGFQIPSVSSTCSPPIEYCNTLESLQRARSAHGDSPPLIVVSALSPEKANIVAMFIRTFGSEAQDDAAASTTIFLDLTDETLQRSLDIYGIAKQNGFRPYGTNAIEAFVIVENLGLLLGQNVPPSFVRIAKG